MTGGMPLLKGKLAYRKWKPSGGVVEVLMQYFQRGKYVRNDTHQSEQKAREIVSRETVVLMFHVSTKSAS